MSNEIAMAVAVADAAGACAVSDVGKQLYVRSLAGKVEALSALPASFTTTPGRVTISGPALAANPERAGVVPVPVPAAAVPLEAGADEVGVVIAVQVFALGIVESGNGSS